ncbi:MAG: DUF4431 domain-containing protein [Verrucomicrobia bacterium]|nr:DUF4431 domain-containing protein [Verrucomicrobiota bacterium]
MKPPAVVLTFLLLALAALAEPTEKPIRERGVVSREVFAGPPNYESVPAGDAREEAWILTTAKQERFHLVVLADQKRTFATLQRCLGRRIQVEGTVWPAETAHHRTPFLITVRSVEEAPSEPAAPTAASGRDARQ